MSRCKIKTYIKASRENNDKNPKFKISDIVKISQYKNIFAKGFVSNWFEEVFLIKKVKSTAPWTYVISDLKGEEFIGMFFSKKNCKETNQKEFRVEKVIQRKDDKLYVKWKDYDNSFNRSIKKT